MSNTKERDGPNLRRIVRTQRLLAELGHTDVIEALDELRRLRASLPPEQEAQQPVSMDDAIAAGDGTLHGAIDYWQERALAAEQAAQAEPAGMRLVSVEQLKRWERWADQHYSTSIRNAIAALLAAPTQASEQAAQVQEPLSDGQIADLAEPFVDHLGGWQWDNGERGIHEGRDALGFARAIERECAVAWGVQLTKEGGNV